jgi:3-deoxy-D-manno-octulosonic-acid transferase
VGLPLDIAYTLALPAFAPALLRKRRSGLKARLGHATPIPSGERPRLLIHAVSVGETNLIAPLVRTLVADHGVEVVVSATTDTGIARATALYEGIAPVVRFPLDFSRCVRRFLDAVRPDAVALTELELWPNFAQECARREIPLAIINGRLSARSFKGYRRARPLLARSFRSLSLCAVQDDEYAERFAAMGVRPDRLIVAGSMKWDSVEVGSEVPGVDELAARLGVDRRRPLVVAGSTAPEEHGLLRDAVPEGVQLLCAPRRPEWFAHAAADLPGCAVWTRNEPGSATGRFVLDTIGELRRAYAMADVVVIGRSFGTLHGSDPMEPAALGKPLVIGPRFEDFNQSVRALQAFGALRVVEGNALAETLRALFDSDETRRQMGMAAIECVRTHSGSSARHAELLLPLLSRSASVVGERAYA